MAQPDLETPTAMPAPIKTMNSTAAATTGSTRSLGTPSKILRRSASSMAEALSKKGDKLVQNEVARARIAAQVNEHLINVIVRQMAGPTFGLRRCEHVHHSTIDHVSDQTPAEGSSGEEENGDGASIPAAPTGSAAVRPRHQTLCEECLAVDEDQARVAGWLCLDQSSKAVTRAVRGASSLLGITHDDWDRRYVVFDPSTLSLKLYKSMGKSLIRDHEADLSISLAMLEAVIPVAFADKSSLRVRYAMRLVYRDSARGTSKLRSIQLKGIEDADIDLTARWAALLLFRSGLYSEDIDDLALVVHRGVLALQRIVRVHVEGALAERARDQANSSSKRRSLRGGHASRFLPNVLRPLFARHDSSSASDPGTDSEEPKCTVPTSLAEHGRSRSMQLYSTQCQDSEAARWVTPLTEGEEEDEFWENERWSFIDLKDKRIKRGWSRASLLPQERKPYTTRIGHTLGRDMNEVEAAVSVPPGWEISTPFIVDTSGMSQSRCDAEGWRYESQFNALDSKQAKGSQRGQANARWVVRQRRWYRRRRPADDAAPEDVARTPSWIANLGWLGMRGLSTGVLWRSRYCLVAMPKCNDAASDEAEEPAPRPGGINVAFWAYFTKDFKGHGAVSNLYDVDWASLSDKFVHIKPLDRSCYVSDRAATADNPGHFELFLSGEAKPRLLNAETRENRVRWMRALREAIAASKTVQETIETLQSEVAFFEDTAQATPRSPSAGRPSSASSRRLASSPAVLSKFDSTASHSGSPSSTRRAASDRSVTGLGLQTIRQYLKRHEEDCASASAGIEEPTRNGEIAGSALALQPADDDPHVNGGGVGRSGSGASSGTDKSSASVATTFPCLGNELIELSLDVDVDTLVKVMFIDPEFQDRLNEMKEYTNVVQTPWRSPSGEEGFAEGARSRASYTIPKKGPVPESRAFSTLTCRKIMTGKGYQVEKATMNPGIPYGKSFRSVLRFNLAAENEAAARLTISHEVVFLEHMVMRAFIRAATLREVRSSYKKAMLELESYLESKHLGSAAVQSQIVLDDGAAVDGSEGAGDTAAAGSAAAPAASKAFDSAEPYENMLVEGTLDADVDTVHRVLHLNSAFTERMFELDKAEDITVGEWTQGNSPGSKRQMQYLIPRKGPIPRNTCYASWEIIQAVPGVGYQVDQEVRNPEVPYGKTFATLLRLVIEATSPSTTRVQASHRVDFRQSTMMKGFIKSSSSREIKKNFEAQWFPELKKFIADPSLQKGGSEKAADGAAAPVKKERAEVAPSPAPPAEAPPNVGSSYMLYGIIALLLALLVVCVLLVLEVRAIREDVGALKALLAQRSGPASSR